MQLATRLHFLRRQGNICALCSEKIINVKCSSMNHVIDAVKYYALIPEERKAIGENLIITHRFCKKFRGKERFIQAAYALERYKKALGNQFFNLIDNTRTEKYPDIHTDVVLEKMASVEAKTKNEIKVFVLKNYMDKINDDR